MSAMLGYLLASDEDHGLGDAFIKVFLSKLNNDLCKKAAMRSFINSQVSLEEPYQLNGARKDIDIQISLLEENHTESIRIIIENKIKVGAANPKQLADYYQAVLQDDPNLKNLVVVFVTPETPNSQLKAEFDNLNTHPDNHFKEWIFWDSNTERGIVSMLREILSMESVGKINPINEYMRHTLKAFIKHASSVVQPMSNITNRMGGDLGEIIDEAIISLNDRSHYRVVRRDSAQIQVFNSETGEKEIAFNILARFIDENNLDIAYQQMNTRTIGRRFFEWYSKSN